MGPPLGQGDASLLSELGLFPGMGYEVEGGGVEGMDHDHDEGEEHYEEEEEEGGEEGDHSAEEDEEGVEEEWEEEMEHDAEGEGAAGDGA